MPRATTVTSSLDIPRVPWADVLPDFLRAWGRVEGRTEPEHLTVLGPTRSGKSRFVREVLTKRADLRGSHIMVVATKPADSTLTDYHWPIIRKWPPQYGDDQFIFWVPTLRDPEANKKMQRAVIRDTLQEIWQPGANMIVVFDELAYLDDREELNLKAMTQRFWREASALGITVVGVTQRPRFISLYAYSEAQWMVAFRPNDEEDAQLVAQKLGSRRKYFDALMSLRHHEFIMRHVRTRQEIITRIT